MRGFGVKVSALSLLVISLAVGIFLFAGCEEDKKEVCCKCTCYVVDGLLPDRTEYVSGTNLNCKSSCRAICVDVHNMELKDPTSVPCDSVPGTDQ